MSCRNSYSDPKQSFQRLLAILGCLVLLVCVLVPYNAHAQKNPTSKNAQAPKNLELPKTQVKDAFVASESSKPDSEALMKAMIKKVGSSTAEVDLSPIQPTTVTPLNMEVHWRLWKRVATKNQSGEGELAAFRRDALSLGHYNLPVYSTAVIAFAKASEQKGDDHAVIAQMYREATRLAPDLPYAELAYASYLYRNQTAELPAMLGAYVRGIKTGIKSLDTRLAWELKFIILALIAFLGASFVFLFAQLVRYFGIIAHDITRLLPHGFSSNQSVVLTIALVVVPGLLLRSPVLSLLILFALIAIFQQLNERVITAIIFAVMLFLPSIDAHVDHLVSFPGSQAQKLMHSQYFYCDEACISLQKQSLQDAEATALQKYTYALAVYRSGQVAQYDELVLMLADHSVWPQSMHGYVDNLHAAILISAGKHQDASPLLDSARAAMPDSAAPSFNVMRVAQLTDQKDAATRALTEASGRDLYAVTDYIERERRDINSFLIVPPLPLTAFWTDHTTHKPENISMIQPLWTSLAGERIPINFSPVFGAIGLVILALSAPLRSMNRTSTPCPRCGLARDPKDSTKMAGHHFCLACFRTFQSGSTLEYQARIHNETVLGRRHRMQAILRRTTSLLLPGSGHALAGHALLGFFTTAMLFLAALSLWQPMGIWRPSFELFTYNWIGQRTLAWIALSICVTIGLNGALRDITPTHPTSPDSRNPQ